MAWARLSPYLAVVSLTAAVAVIGDAANWAKGTTFLVMALVLAPAAVALVALSEGIGTRLDRHPTGSRPKGSPAEPRDLRRQFAHADSGIVVDLASRVASALALDPDTVRAVTLTAALRDVGNERLPADILDKPGALGPADFELVKTHTVAGEAILEKAGGDLRPIAALVRSCHERWDGRGYPDGLSGESIPLASRIVFCCDAFGAMTRNRPYRRAMPVILALEELKACAGAQFDPYVVEIVCELIESEAVDRSEPVEAPEPRVLPASLQPA